MCQDCEICLCDVFVPGMDVECKECEMAGIRGADWYCEAHTLPKMRREVENGRCRQCVAASNLGQPFEGLLHCQDCQRRIILTQTALKEGNTVIYEEYAHKQSLFQAASLNTSQECQRVQVTRNISNWKVIFSEMRQALISRHRHQQLYAIKTILP